MVTSSVLAQPYEAYNTSDLNSWWGKNNQTALDYIRATQTGPYRTFELIPTSQAPSDWDAFREAFGDGYASPIDYDNWRRNQQRQRDLVQFVDKMATADPALANFTAQMGEDYGQFRGYVDDWVKAPRPVMDTSNRFEAGLSANERRLEALLNDPDSINQSAAYKFRLKQGEDAIQRQLGAKGLLGSGNRLQALTQYGQDMASQEYDNQARRLSDLVGQYSASWLGDKNANTNKYNAESQAWNQRGSVLGDLFAKAGTNYASAQKIQGDNRLGWADNWTKVAGKPFQQYADGTLTTWNWG